MFYRLCVNYLKRHTYSQDLQIELHTQRKAFIWSLTANIIIFVNAHDFISIYRYKIGDVGQGLSEWNRNAYITAHEQKQPTCAFETMADSLVHKYLTNVTKRFYVDRKSNCNKTANIRMHIGMLY